VDFFVLPEFGCGSPSISLRAVRNAKSVDFFILPDFGCGSARVSPNPVGGLQSVPSVLSVVLSFCSL
jgi:hypothetical protein